MCRRAAAIKQTCFAQNERADVNGCDSARLPVAALQKIYDFVRRFTGVRGRVGARARDEEGVERDVVSRLRLHRDAKSVGYRATANRYDVRLVIGLAQHHICRLKDGERGETQVGEPRWHE